MESNDGEEFGSVMDSGEADPLALRARFVRRFGLVS